MTVFRRNVTWGNSPLSVLATDRMRLYTRFDALKHLAFWLLCATLSACVSPLEKPLPIESDSVSAVEIENTPGIVFLKNIKNIFASPQKSAEEIASIFGWHVEDVSEGDSIVLSTFNSRNDSVVRNESAKLYFYEKTKRATFSVSNLRESGVCISAEDVVSIFGRGFRPSFTSIDHAPEGVEVRRLSDKVEKNQSLFMAGPVYRIDSPVSASLHFSFTNSECLGQVSVIHPPFN